MTGGQTYFAGLEKRKRSKTAGFMENLKNNSLQVLVRRFSRGGLKMPRLVRQESSGFFRPSSVFDLISMEGGEGKFNGRGRLVWEVLNGVIARDDGYYSPEISFTHTRFGERFLETE